MMTDEQRDAKIAALIRERAGCDKYSLTDRVEEIDAELRRLGAEGMTPVKRATRRAEKTVEPPPKRRAEKQAG